MEAFLKSLLSLSIGGSLVAGLLALLARSAKNRLPKSFFYYAWLLVLLRLALPIPGQLDLKLPQPPAPVAEVVEILPPEIPDGPMEITPEVPEATFEYLTQSRYDIPQYTPDQTAPEVTKPQRPQVNIALGLTLIWAVGFLISMCRDILGYYRFRYAIHKTMIPPSPSDLALYCSLAGKRRPRLYRSAAVDTPMLMGILHPTLVLPDRKYAPKTLECVLLHELTHYTRHDILYKWFTVPVMAMHWFNPLMRLIRRDIDRCCELSCDEKILKGMDHDQRKIYGETLLVMAARSAPSRTVLSTTFATQKKNLKERLVHIMNFSPKSKWAILAAVILLIAVAVCAVVFGPQAEAPEVPETTPVTEAVTEPQAEPVAATEPPETTIAGEATAVVVSTVDELLDAIASDTEITLEPGTYDLTTAKGYGDVNLSNPNYRWDEVHEGFQLSIINVKNLTITGADKEKCEIVTVPRYSAVLNFENCEAVKISDITAGHTEGPGTCVGAVIRLMGSANVTVDNSILYGCGTYGVEGHRSNGVVVANCDIKECSLGATTFTECKNVQVRSCRIFDNGLGEWPGYELFYFAECRNCVVQDCEITNCKANSMLTTTTCKDIYFLSNQFNACTFDRSVIDYNGTAPIVDACSFRGVSGSYAMISTVPTLAQNLPGERIEGKVLSLDGKELSGDQLKSMTYAETNFTLPVFQESGPTPVDYEGTPPTNNVVEVATVDEFLAAIAPNTTVKLAEGTYDLSTASDFGTGWEDYYRWTEVFDGFELEIMNVDNFHIMGAGQNKTILTAVPRYADVLMFTGCTNISVAGITAGHTIEPGYCTGGVLTFDSCARVAIDSCGLYGCGIYGIIASSSSDFAVTNTEIYDCSNGAVILKTCVNWAFDQCNIHDCPMPYFTLTGDCSNISVNGDLISAP